MTAAEQERMRKLAERFSQASERIEGLERQLEAAQERAKAAERTIETDRGLRMDAEARGREDRRALETSKEQVGELVELTRTQGDQIRELKAAGGGAARPTGDVLEERQGREEAERLLAESAVEVERAQAGWKAAGDRNVELSEQVAALEAEVREALASVAGADERAAEAQRRLEVANLTLEVVSPRLDAICGVLGLIGSPEPPEWYVAQTRKLLTISFEQGVASCAADLREAGQAHAETQSDLEERQGWANLTQGELDRIADLLGIAKDAAYDVVYQAVAALVAERAELGTDHAPTRARAHALGAVAALLGVRRNVPADRVVALVEELVAAKAPVIVRDEEAIVALDQVLVAVWPGRESSEECTPALECVEAAVARIRRMAADAAGEPPVDVAERSGLRDRLFNLLLEKARADDVGEDVLDRLERLAGV